MCERSGEAASSVVARYYEVEKGENHEMVEGTSWMVRWKAVGKAVSTYAQSRRGSKSSSSERASGNSHPCPIQPYVYVYANSCPFRNFPSAKGMSQLARY